MPGKDGTGPTGEGPAGRKMGPCRDPDAAEEAAPVENGAATNNGDAIGVGRGGKPRGCGRGRCGGGPRRRQGRNSGES